MGLFETLKSAFKFTNKSYTETTTRPSISQPYMSTDTGAKLPIFPFPLIMIYELADNIFAQLGDKKWAGELYYKAEEKAEDCCDLVSLAECFIEKLGNGEEASRVYKKAETQAEDSLDFYCLAESIVKTLRDRKWADNVVNKAQL